MVPQLLLGMEDIFVFLAFQVAPGHIAFTANASLRGLIVFHRRLGSDSGWNMVRVVVISLNELAMDLWSLRGHSEKLHQAYSHL